MKSLQTAHRVLSRGRYWACTGSGWVALDSSTETSLHVPLYTSTACFIRHSSTVAPSRPELTTVKGETPLKLPNNIMAALHKHEQSFLGVFNDPSAKNSPIEDWIQTYYRRPRPDLALGAMIHAFRTPGAFCGEGAFPAAVFLSLVLKATCKSSQDTAVLLHLLRGIMVTDELPTEPLDTVLRAMYLACEPHFDALLKEVSSAWVQELSLSSTPEKHATSNADMAALATSLFPLGEPGHTRLPMMAWSIPSVDLTRFQAAVSTIEYTHYAASRHLWSLTRSIYVSQREDPALAPLMAPPIATAVSRAMVDGYWSTFYATGDGKAISKVLDVGTAYMEFIDEYGDSYVTNYSPDDVLPLEFHDDPYSCMKFESSRYALWTLLVNGGTHTLVGEFFMSQLGKLMDHVAASDPISVDADMTSFGKQRLALMKLLLPSIQTLGSHASLTGIGSGVWPARYTAHEDHSHVPRPALSISAEATSGNKLLTDSAAFTLVEGESSALGNATSYACVDVGAQVAKLMQQGAGSAAAAAPAASRIVSLDTRDRRHVDGMRR